MTPPLTPHETEVARQMQICNACRYCEGFCAVFPAMTRRLEFDRADIHYLANLCHNCGACYHACQYAEPHAFAVNVPRAMAQVRRETYGAYAWPLTLGRLYRHNGLTLVLALGLSLGLFLILTLRWAGTHLLQPLSGNFYAIFPHSLLVTLFGSTFGLALLVLFLGLARFWRDSAAGKPSVPALREATQHALTLTYLGGGQEQGCNEVDDRPTLVRRRFHHLTFYGFLLCFAATLTATVDHYVLGEMAPYPFSSAPVLLGTLGGIGLMIGPAGLLWLNLQRDPKAGDPAQRPMDRGFIILLLLTSATGLALLAWRDSAFMALLLALHLGAVLALFVTLPYGKFTHGLYRSAALLKWTIEKRRKETLL